MYVKAYPNDKHGQEDWQILDFMEKLGYQYPEENVSSPDYFPESMCQVNIEISRKMLPQSQLDVCL